MKSLTRQEWYGALVAVIVLGVLLTFASPYFLTTGNLSNVLVQASVIALLAGGQTFVILTAGVDLAVGAVTALAGAVAGHLMLKAGIDPYAAMLVAVAIGLGVKVCTWSARKPFFFSHSARFIMSSSVVPGCAAMKYGIRNCFLPASSLNFSNSCLKRS